MKIINRNLKSWKANLKIWQSRNDTEMVDFAEGVIFGLELALGSTEKPCNTHMHVDAALCDECIEIGRTGEHSWHCRKCGKELHQ